jgi:hypothetical protein
MLIEIPLEGQGFFNRIEVLPLQVLNNGEFGNQPVVRFANACGNRLPSRELGCPQTPFTTNELIPSIHPPHEDRLEHVMLLKALSERCDFRFAEISAWLEGILLDLVDGELQESAVFRGGFLKQRTR